MNYLKTKRMKVSICLVVLFMLFQVYKFIEVRLTNIDLPKGKFVFCSGLHGNNEVYLMNINGTDLQRITKYSFFGPTFESWISDFRASFSSNGRKIVFELDRDDKGPRMERTHYSSKTVGERSLPTHQDVYTIESNGEGLARLTYSSIGSGALFFSPDNQKILFHSDPFPNDPFYEELKIIDSNGANETTLAKGWGIARFARFSFDSQKVFLSYAGIFMW